MQQKQKNISRRQFLNSAMVATAAGAAAAVALTPEAQASVAAPLPGVLTPAYRPRRQDAPVSLLDDIQDRGVLRVGMTLQFEPQMYRDESGEPAGYDVELVKLMAADIGTGVELDIQDQEFDGLIPALLAGKVDIISVGLVGRPGGRLETMWFSTPYVPYQQVLIVPTDSTITEVSELNAAGKKITALTGSTAAGLAARLFPEAEIVELQQQPALLEVASGRADGGIVEAYLAVPFVEENPTAKIFNPEDPFSLEFGSYAVPRGDLDWLTWVNGWLRYRKGQGVLQALYDQIIGPSLGDSPVYKEIPAY
ncbi:MAG TPA: transporter substrate-binding domain-containing protein [Anaerolineae bacterium]|nr:transporter substrate-binding domain-containing protein [Anaerolineae bacterium]